MSAVDRTLGELCTFERGLSATLKTPQGKHPLVVTADFRRSADSWQIEGPAVCIPLVSSTGHGDAALHRVHYQEGRFALANLLVALKPRDSRLLDAKYLYHLLMARKDDLLVPLMLGTANVSLKEKDIATVTIPVPAIAIQQRIVARIDAIAAKVEAARQLRGKVEDEAAAYVVSLHSKLAGERTKALGEILVLDEDAKTVSPDSSYPQVGVRSFGAGLFRKGAVEGFETTYRAFNRLYSGAVVLSQVKGWEGAIAVCPADLEGWYVSPEYRTFRCRPTEALPEYLAALLPTEWFWSHLGAATRGVGARRERTRPEQFLQLRIPMPNITAQEFAARTFAQLGALCDFQNQALSELDAIMPAVLDRAFKGRAAGSAIVETMTDAEALE